MSDAQRDYEPIQPHGTDWRGRIRKAIGPAIALVIAAAKWSFVLLKFSSIFIAVAAYALIFGWKFAVGFVLLIFVHELGHYIEAKREGLSPKLPVFIPFLGAYVKYTRGHPWQTVRVAIAGPDGMRDSDELDGRSNQRVGTDADLRRVQEHAVHVDKRHCAEMDVHAVVAEEWRFDPHTVAHASEELREDRVTPRRVDRWRAGEVGE